MVSAQEKGATRISFSDAQEINRIEVFGASTPEISQDTLTPVGENWQALPTVSAKSLPLISQGSKVLLEFKPEANGDIIESEESDVSIPVQIFDLRTGAVVQDRVLKLEDFTGFKPSGSVNSAVLDNTFFNRVATFPKPDGFGLRLAQGKKVFAYWGDDTA